MDERRWEDLNIDCMVNILGRVGMESLLLDVPFVCKSWYRASLNPSCWERLIFPDIKSSYSTLFVGIGGKTLRWFHDPKLERFIHQYQIDESHFSTTAFIKFVVNRSNGHATALRLPPCASETDLKYVSDVCGDLKAVGLPGDLVNDKSGVITELIGKWKRLEWLMLGSSYDLVKILSQISIHCKDFWGLRVSNADIFNDEAIAIVNFLPKIKHLILRKAEIDRDALMKLLQGCTELRVLDVSDCIGFSEDDEEILKLASHITNFSCKGSREYDYDDDGFYEDGSFLFDDVVYDGYYSD
ncbi:PREDICTED: F-box/LRR-repeat [Prunus dulcis]|uniref:PREDICTED: F-box/LRR-repeat n=1 Tax=Prunus dulcis TaxID=3755 RepID=A0A5E4FBH7_PRUDU|nr:F-box/LRR-repeat protein At3g48880-like [Prunus dulcis]VVA25474.1 PREDICTED: F-box/LRR-repeat [Prunus dulcis]